MKGINKLFAAVFLLFAAVFLAANLICSSGTEVRGRPWAVETERLCRQLSEGAEPDLSSCEYVTKVTEDDGTPEFYEQNGSCLFRSVGGRVYRFDHSEGKASDSGRLILNLSVGAAALLTFGVLIYVRRQIIKPFNEMSNVPYELSRGNLAVPLKESKNRYFGRYVWGTDMLRESIEQQRSRELGLQKDKQTLLLSISHDIKTPLSAIKLYASALQRGLYKDEEKLREVYASLGEKAREIENYTVELTRSAGGDFLALEVKNGEAYLSELVEGVRKHYTQSLELLHTELVIGEFTDCIVSCDPDRAAEVLQNLMENAIKYGDGQRIALSFSEEEDCRLVTVTNGGCTLADGETLHIFDSFWRGSNSEGKPGSGLGLYICRQLMHKMNGDIFAHCENGSMSVTAVFRKL